MRLPRWKAGLYAALLLEDLQKILLVSSGLVYGPQALQVESTVHVEIARRAPRHVRQRR